MATRFVNIQVCVLLALAYSYSAAALAEEPENKETNVVNVEKEERSLVLDYSSVFENYIPFDDVPEIGWREANDNVARIGGWRAYLKMVQEEVMKEAQLKEAEAEVNVEIEKGEPEHKESEQHQGERKTEQDDITDLELQKGQQKAIDGFEEKARKNGGHKL